MKTFKIHIIRKVIQNTIDSKKYFKFTIKNERTGRPDKCKAQISSVFGSPQGMIIQFRNVYINKKLIFKDISLKYKYIRWIDNPFTKNFENECEVLSTNRGLTTTLSEMVT